jgi:hypothetical protein
MTRFTTFLALVVGGMEVIPSAATVLAAGQPGLTAKIHLRSVGVDPFQRRQGLGPAPTCDAICTPIINTVASNVCHTK